MKHLVLVILFLVVTSLTGIAGPDNEKAVALLLEQSRCTEPHPSAALFPELPAIVILPATSAPDTPWQRMLANPSPSIRIKDRFVPLNTATPSFLAPTIAIPRWRVRQQLRSLDSARRYAPVYGTGTGAK